MPQQVGRYQIEEELRTTATGRLVRARLPGLGRSVYLHQRHACVDPEVLAGAESLDAFQRQSRLLARHSDTVIARPIDTGIAGAGHPFLVYSLPEDDGFSPLPVDNRALSPGAWISTGAGAARALAGLASADVYPTSFDAVALFVRPDGQLRLIVFDPGGEPAREGELVRSLAGWLHSRLAGEATPGSSQSQALWLIDARIPAAVDELLRRTRAVNAGGCSLESLAVALERAAPPDAGPAAAELPADTEVSPALRFGAWTVGLGLAGTVAGWVLAQLFPPR